MGHKQQLSGGKFWLTSRPRPYTFLTLHLWHLTSMVYLKMWQQNNNQSLAPCGGRHSLFFMLSMVEYNKYNFNGKLLLFVTNLMKGLFGSSNAHTCSVNLRIVHGLILFEILFGFHLYFRGLWHFPSYFSLLTPNNDHSAVNSVCRYSFQATFCINTFYQ